jgi:hypothetical protein
MAAKGTHKISDKKKAAIIVDKRIRTDSIKAIGLAHGVSTNHVHKIAREASPEVLEMADQLEEELAPRIEKTMNLALTRIHERLANDANPAPLNHITTAFGVLYDKRALENNRPTSIVQHTSSPEEHAIEFYKILLNKMDKQDALSMFRNSNLAPLVSDHTRDRVALQLESGEVNPDAKPDS